MLRRLARLLAPAAGCLEGEAASLWLQQQDWRSGLELPLQRSYASTVGGGGGSDAFESDTNLVQQPPAAAGRRLGPTSELGQPQASRHGRGMEGQAVLTQPALLACSSRSSSRPWLTGRQLCAASPLRRSLASLAASSSSSSSSGSSNDVISSGSSNEAAGSEQPFPLVRHYRSGKMVRVRPEIAAALPKLAQRCVLSSAHALILKVATLDAARQDGIVQNGRKVAQHLASLGVGQHQLGRLLLRCPRLFSWPAEERAAVLFGQLQGLGLTAAQAATCFEQRPSAANTASFEAGIEALLQLYEAAGSKGGSPAERLCRLLRNQPGAICLLGATALKHHIDNLRHSHGLSGTDLAAAMCVDWTILSRNPEHLAARRALLQQELGMGAALWAKLLCFAPQVVFASESTIRERARALAKEFGREEALEMVDAAPGLLCIRSFVWRIALAAMRLHGVADVAAVMQNNGNAATKNWLAVPRLMNRLALQHSLQLSPAQVYEQHAGYMANTGAERLIARLRFLEHSGMPLQQLLLQGEQAVQARQQECGLPLIGEAEGEPKAISLRDLCVLPDAQFASLPAVQAAGGLPVLRAFQAALKSAPGWLELQAAAEVEQAQLLPQLPASLRLAAEERQQRGRRHGRWRKSRAQVEQ